MELSENEHLSKEIIDTFHEELRWEYVTMCCKLDKELIDKYYHKIYWNNLVCNNQLDEEVIDSYIDKLDRMTISRHSNLTPELMIKHMDKLDWSELCQHPKINVEVVLSYDGKPGRKGQSRKYKWFRHGLTINDNIPYDFILNYPSLGWKSSSLSSRSYLPSIRDRMVKNSKTKII